MYRPLLALLLLAVTALAEGDKVAEILKVDLPDISPYVQKERFSKPIPELSYGPIWDFRKLAVETFGVQLRPDDILLWAPADKRIYIRSSPDTVNFLAGMLGPEFGLTWIELEFVLSEVTKGKAEPVVRFKIHTKTGMRSETSFSEKDSGISSAKVGAEAIIGPDGEQIDLNAAVNFKSATRSFDFTGSYSLKKDTETTIWETEDKASDAIYRCTVKPSIFFEDVSIKMQPGPARDKLLKAVEARLEGKAP